MTARPLAVLLVGLSLTTASCGIRVSDEEVVKAAGGGTAVVQGGAAVTGNVDPGTGAPLPGASTGAVVPGSPATTGGSTVTTTGGTTTTPGGTTTGTTGTTGAPGAAGGGPDILVGNVGQYSGPIGSALAGAPTMLRVWAASVNAKGGLLGRQVKVVSANDQGDPSNNKQLVQDQVENKRVVALVGNQVPLSVQGSAEYLNSKKVPAVGGDVSSSLWNTSPMLFPQGESVRNIIYSLAKVAVQAGKKKMAIFYCVESQANCVLANELLTNQKYAEKAGGQMVYSAQVSITQPDFAQQCLQAQQKGAEALLMFGDPNTIGRIANSCSSQGYKPQYVTGSLAVNNGLKDNKNLEGLLAPQPWFGWPLQNAATQEYRDAIKRYAPDLEDSSATASVWAAAKLFELAVTNAAPKAGAAVTSADVLRGLWQVKGQAVPGLTPKLTFVQDKPAQPAANCYFLVAVKGGTWTETDGGTPACNDVNLG